MDADLDEFISSDEFLTAMRKRSSAPAAARQTDIQAHGRVIMTCWPGRDSRQTDILVFRNGAHAHLRGLTCLSGARDSTLQSRSTFHPGQELGSMSAETQAQTPPCQQIIPGHDLRCDPRIFMSAASRGARLTNATEREASRLGHRTRAVFRPAPPNGP